MIDSALYHRLSPVARRFQLRRLFLTLATLWTLAALLVLSLWWLKSADWFYSVWTLPSVAALTFLATLGGIWFALRSPLDEDFSKTAHDIEQRFPELNASLITAVEQVPAVAHGKLGYLQQEVVRKAVYHGYQNSWARVVPQWQLWVLPVLTAAGLLTFLTAVLGYLLTPLPAPLAAVAGEPGTRVVSPTHGDFRIEPGDVEVERFSSLMVLARFANDHLPGNAQLKFWNQDQQTTMQDMNKSLDDPVFGTRIAAVQEPLQYAVCFDGQETQPFRISVFEYPALQRADAQLVFPEYTRQESKRVQDVRRVSGVQGTQVTWLLTLNKPIQSGRLLGEDGQEVSLLADPADPQRYLAEISIQESCRYTLKLIDAESRENKSPPTLTVQMLGNQAPEIKQLSPAADTEVSPVEELGLTATFRDDIGLQRAGLTWSMVGQPETEIELVGNLPANELREIQHILAFEDLDAQPNQLLTFYFWAEDLADNGQPRRSLGDIHMVSVRDFESIFRQGQQQPGGAGGGGQGGGQGEPGMELSDLQREIVYAIWNLSRRQSFGSVTEKFADDVAVVSESQQTAITMLDEAAQMLPDDSLQPIVEEIRRHQTETIADLTQALENASADPLSPALLSAQLADQALLKLRALESEVAQSQQPQSGGGGGGGSRQRQQMQQLQLENDENRYEQEKTASERQESGQERENRQVLSRLRELARRQNDLNQRIKELQSALQEAETPDEREQIEEQLKRLREEQQQILRDTEELQERMEQPQNRSEMSEQARQLEQARENARQASDALAEGDATRAAAEGTRALRDMESLRDEFQNRSSGQFDQQMQQMRNEARDIENDQQQIANELEQLNSESQGQPQSLTEMKPENDLDERLQQQRSRVESLRESMRTTIEEAEEFEPILAETLYDAYRRSLQESPAEALDSTRQSLKQGFVDDARREQRRAAQGIADLREGIDQAAESVLGDETEALRRASRELQRLANALEDEFERNNPPNADADPATTADARQAGRENENPNSERDPAAADDPRPAESAGRSGDPSDNPQGDPNRPENEAAAGQGEKQDATSPPAGGAPAGQDSTEASEDETRSTQPGGQPGAGDRDPQNPNPRTGDNPNGRNETPAGGQRQGRQNQQGALGADPEINYGGESWDDPISGEDFLPWSDRMRDVEEMVADPELRAEATRIREQARSIRRDIKRHAEPPNWDLVRLKVIEPMVQLQDRVHEELIRRSGNKSRVPVDRDPVPAEFENAVQQYFEQLGRGQ